MREKLFLVRQIVMSLGYTQASKNKEVELALHYSTDQLKRMLSAAYRLEKSRGTAAQLLTPLEVDMLLKAVSE